MLELVKKSNVHANQITEWEKQMLGGAPDVFGKGACEAEDAEQTVSELHAKLGTAALATFMDHVGDKVRAGTSTL